MGLFSEISKAWKKYVTGSYYQDKANEAARNEANRQDGVRNGMLAYIDEINKGLQGQRYDYLNAVLNANSTGNAYLNNYLASLNGLADTNYNQGVTALHRSIANTENNIRNQMANRGISGAGVDFKNLVNSQGALARGISALQAQRQQDKANVEATKYSAGSNTNATNFGRLQSYYSYNPQMSQADAMKLNVISGSINPSEYTQNLINQYQNKANNPALGKVVSATVNAAAGNWLGAAGSLLGNKSSGGSTGTSVFGNSGYNNNYLSLGTQPYVSDYNNGFQLLSSNPSYLPYSYYGNY